MYFYKIYNEKICDILKYYNIIYQNTQSRKLKNNMLKLGWEYSDVCLEYADHDDKTFYMSHNLDGALEFKIFLHITFHKDTLQRK